MLAACAHAPAGRAGKAEEGASRGQAAAGAAPGEPRSGTGRPGETRDSAQREQGATRALGEGTASYYGAALRGHRTANGERFDPGALTAAHRTLPFGTCLRVLNAENGRSVEVRINDRGPFAPGRILDLSEAAARVLGMLRSGLARVRLFACRGA